MSSKATVSTDLLRMLLIYARQLGIDVEQHTSEAGIAQATLAERDARVGFGVYAHLFDSIADASEDPCFGLRFGVAIGRMGTGHLLATLLMNCPTMLDALERLARYHGLMTDAIVLRVVAETRDVVLTIEAQSPRLPRQQVEAVVALFASVLRNAAPNPVAPRSVELAWPPPEDRRAYEQLLQCAHSFNSNSTRLIIDKADLLHQLPLADPALLSSLERIVRDRIAKLPQVSSWTTRTQAEIYRILEDAGTPKLGVIAKNLGASERTLQVHLKSEGASFKDLLDGLRKELAIDYVRRSELSLCEVAFWLGYSEQSAFNHAFRRWTGMTPRGFRRTM